MKKLPVFLLSAAAFLIANSPLPAVAADGFAWNDTEGKHTDLTFNGRNVARYQYERIDESSPARREETYKPHHQVYDWDGKGFITKGHGGQYTHHRGIYFGFSKCSFTTEDGKKMTGQDTWHCRKAHQTHEKFIEQTATADSASQTVEIDWRADDGSVFAKEKRTLTFSFAGDDLVVNFTSTLTPTVPSMKVDGDPQHAGFHFRASNEVSAKTKNKTYYIRQETGKGEMGKTINWSGKDDNEHTRDLAWKGMSVVIGEDRYSVAYLDSPENPKPARFSERDYGRFGSYFVKEITPETPMTVNYGLVIRKGEFEADEIAKLSDEFLKK